MRAATYYSLCFPSYYVSMSLKAQRTFLLLVLIFIRPGFFNFSIIVGLPDSFLSFAEFLTPSYCFSLSINSRAGKIWQDGSVPWKE